MSNVEAPKPKNSSELTYKTAWRLFATAQTLIFLAADKGAISKLESDSKIHVALASLAVCVASFAAADGITDLAKGTHHYLGLKTLRIFSNSEGKKKIDEALKDEIAARDQKVIFRRPKA